MLIMFDFSVENSIGKATREDPDYVADERSQVSFVKSI